MGYFNPVLQYGVENFLKAISEVGVDGCILPDLPLLEYNSKYKALFEKYSLDFIPLITPTTPDKRYPEIEAASSAFIYAVSSTAVTGGSATTQRREDYFEKLGKMSKPVIVGFGIATKADFELATKEAAGAIVGSAFLKALKKESPIESGKAFVKKLM
jgi:tryptophan synthase alpha chain